MGVDFSKHFSLGKFSSNTRAMTLMPIVIHYENTELLHDILKMVKYSVVIKKN